jgi:hypothetical protein
LDPLHNVQGHEMPKIHLQVKLFSWFRAHGSLTFPHREPYILQEKIRIFAFVRFVPLFTTQVFGNEGLEITEGRMIPLTHY